MSLKSFVLSSVDPAIYYKARFPKWIANTNVPCVFHDDNSPSLSLNLNNGGARCHASTCQQRIGNIVHFEAQASQISEAVAAQKLYVEFVRPILSPKIVKQLSDNLAANANLLLKLRKEMGLSPFSVHRFQLGFDLVSKRITIPIWDAYGNIINIRYYRLPSERRDNEVKIYNHKKGYGSVDLFPWPEILKFKSTKPIYFMASEKEAMMMNHYGHQAVCSTTGEGSFDAAWNGIFFNRDVRIVLDDDDGGKVGARKLAAFLASADVKSVTTISIPFTQKRKDHKDFADWVLKQKGDPHRLDKIAGEQVAMNAKDDDTNRHSPSEARSADDELPKGRKTPALPSLSEGGVDIAAIGSRADLLNKRVRCHGIVASKASNSYSIPWKFKISPRKKPAYVYDLEIGRDLLRFVRSGDAIILQALQKILNSPAIKAEVIERITVTEVELIPIAAIDRDVPYVVQRCFYFGEKIDANVPYILDVIPTTEIRTQETVGLIVKIETISKSIDMFDLTPELEAELAHSFQPGEWESAWEKLESTANQIADNYTRVYNRLDWHLVALLTWLSPIGWHFPGEESSPPQRGWLNSLALGDTETGKTKVCRALQQIFNCGVFVNAENCTYVGLVGGAIKAGSGQLMLRWGRIPLSDRQLVVLEELSGLSVEEISNMSEVRSSGIARLDKGGINSQTNSRTRLLCLSNVRSQYKNLSGYLFGVKAIQELIGHGEDIARFDLITTLVDNEVDIGVINRRADFATDANFDDPISESALRSLAQFVWSLTPSQIEFDEQAYDECLNQTKRLAGVYHSSIPIFKGGSGRYKLGRIAASIACFQFNWHSDRIIVTRSHVMAAARLLELIYKKASFGYKQYSLNQFDSETIKNGDELNRLLKEKIPSKRTLAETLEALIYATKFSREEFITMSGLPSYSAETVLNKFYLSRTIRKGYGNIWEITPAGKFWLERLINKLK